MINVTDRQGIHAVDDANIIYPFDKFAENIGIVGFSSQNPTSFYNDDRLSLAQTLCGLNTARVPLQLGETTKTRDYKLKTKATRTFQQICNTGLVLMIKYSERGVKPLWNILNSPVFKDQITQIRRKIKREGFPDAYALTK